MPDLTTPPDAFWLQFGCLILLLWFLLALADKAIGIYKWANERNAAERGKPVNGTSGAQPPSFWTLEFQRIVEDAAESQNKSIEGMLDKKFAEFERNVLLIKQRGNGDGS